MKANKDKVTYANAGVGSASHLCGMLFMTRDPDRAHHGSVQGHGPAMNDLLGGQVDFMCDQTTNTTGQIKAGKVKVYARHHAEARAVAARTADHATSRACQGFDVAIWHGLYAPKGTPKPVVDKLVGALQAALKDPNVKQRFAELGTEPVSARQGDPGSAGQARQVRRSTSGVPIIKKAGVYAD